jgi:hypothetical protein
MQIAASSDMRIQRTQPNYDRTDDRWIVDLARRGDLLDGLTGIERLAGRRELAGVGIAERPGRLPLAAATSRAPVARSRMNVRSTPLGRALETVPPWPARLGGRPYRPLAGRAFFDVTPIRSCSSGRTSS